MFVCLEIRSYDSCRVKFLELFWAFHIAVVLYIADVPLGEEMVFPKLGENNLLSVATGLGVGMSSPGRVSTHLRFTHFLCSIKVYFTVTDCLTSIWDVQCEVWAILCSCYVNIMLEADMRFVFVWPSKEQLTLWKYLTLSKLVNNRFPNLCRMKKAKTYQAVMLLLLYTSMCSVLITYYRIVKWNDLPTTLQNHTTPWNS